MFYSMVGNINNLIAAVFNMFTTSKSCGKFFFDQRYQAGKIISQVLAWLQYEQRGESIFLNLKAYYSGK